MTSQTLEQERAKDAWKKAENGLSAHGKDYMNDAKGLPALIMNSGLMQVMAFLHQKGGRHEYLANDLRKWMKKQLGTPDGFSEFMLHLMEADSRRYQQITREAFAWLKWLRQMAAAHNGNDG